MQNKLQEKNNLSTMKKNGYIGRFFTRLYIEGRFLLLIKGDLFTMKKFLVIFFVLVLGVSSQVLAQRSFDNPPSPLFSNLLQTVKIDRRDKLNLEPVYVYFLPSDKGKVRVLKDGKELTAFNWRASVGDRSGNLFKISDYNQNGNPDGFKLTSGGNYELVYETNGKVFYKFPFRLEKASDDEYSSNSDWVIRGDIENYAYLIQDRSRNWMFKFYHRSNDANRTFGLIEVFKGGKKIGFSKTAKMGLVTSKDWKRYEYRLSHLMKMVKGTYTKSVQRGGEPLNLKTLSDGVYTIKLMLDGKLHGTYKFDMKGGEIQSQDRQKEGTNPLRYIEGGGAAFWLKKM